MKLDRRSFIMFALGAGAGFGVTPVNWKLMDDAAIWTQNWSWVPQPKSGAQAFINTACPATGDDLTVRLITDRSSRAVQVAGNENSPLNRGGVSPMGAAALQYVYMDDNRVPRPMMRVKGGGAFRPVSWDKAIEMVAAKLADCSPEEIALFTGRGESTINRLLGRFMAGLGSDNFFKMADGQDAQAAAVKLLGGEASAFGFDFENADCVLSIGSAIMEGWGHRGRMGQVIKAWRQGDHKKWAKIIQVSPLAGMSATKADMWLPAKPGSEVYVAFALARKLIKIGPVSPQAAEAPGFEDFSAWLDKTFPAVEVKKRTGLDDKQIETAAAMMAKAPKAVAVSGLGRGQKAEPVGLAVAALAINLIKGNLNKPGGVFLTPQLPGVGGPEPRLGGHAFMSNVAHGHGKLKLAMFHEANPVYAGPEPKVWQEALDKAELKVSFSPYWDETSVYCDLILPDHSFLEKWDDAGTALGVPFQTLSVSKPVIKPRLETKATGEAIIALAAKLGGKVKSSVGFDSFEAAIKTRLEALWQTGKGVGATTAPPAAEKMMTGSGGKGFGSAGELAKAVVASGLWYRPGPAGAEFAPNFETFLAAAGKVEDFSAGHMNDKGLTLAGYESLRLVDGFHANPPFLTKLLDADKLLGKMTFAEINPADAEKHGLKEGDTVVLRNREGAGKVKVHLTEAAMPGVVYAPFGFGRTSFDPTIRNKGVNAAALVEAVADPLGGEPTAVAAPVELAKA